jgi:cystathionine gamma-synthase/methionine-gamma-lyase
VDHHRAPSIFTLAVQNSPPVEDREAAQPSIPPIVPSVGFIHPTMQDTDHALGSPGGSSAHPEEYVYSRYGAPTQAAFEDAVARLEGGEAGLSFASGMAAIHAALLTAVPAGGKLVAAQQVYGATHTLLHWLAANLGVKLHIADALDLAEIEHLIAEVQPHAVICEALTNPLARVVRVDRIFAAARAVGAVAIVDNTFATPYLLRPLDLGANLVVHSATKFLNGHGDVTGGVIVGSAALIEQARQHRKVIGGMLGAFDAWLALRGLRTLPLRMRQSCESAMRTASWLAEQPRISRVYFPGLPSDPCHADARALFMRNGFGSIIAFEIDGAKRTEAFHFVEGLRIIRPVTSLGDFNSLILHPATSSHRALTDEERAARSINEGTLRLSVGIEDPDDLIADLAGALQTIR